MTTKARSFDVADVVAVDYPNGSMKFGVISVINSGSRTVCIHGDSRVWDADDGHEIDDTSTPLPVPKEMRTSIRRLSAAEKVQYHAEFDEEMNLREDVRDELPHASLSQLRRIKAILDEKPES